MSPMKPVVNVFTNILIAGALVLYSAIVTSAQDVPKLKQKMFWELGIDNVGISN